MTELKQLRVWWNSNFGSAPFTKEVKDIEEAKFIIQTLSDYDLYLDDLIESNACGVEEYVGKDVDYETNDGWSEYYNDEGQDIGEIMDNG